ncbi:MAG TPA: hypothetical protein PKW75_09225 [candidate division Zixibacteria bacterium]|nr:hypothetical protein [candidate division Zixibacteria bacterium]MDD4918272.1 hypothetical protein [candidate division Zixibacteria bacterium]MDM7973171.1 hypothetical protein [candidate division Zixibacteria bacterium]HOD65851.1 hypothetical protein [candidate division Zixibacteria bacterium]HOZ08454.1 hypothetical protein [candidate division Zixibacteria bacterium]
MKVGFRALLVAVALAGGVSLGLFELTADALTSAPPADYPAYFWDRHVPRTLYVYHTGSGTIDTMSLAQAPRWGVTVSADGGRLYLAADSLVAVLSARTLQTIAELPYRPGGPVAVSPDGRLVAVVGDSVVVLAAADHRPIHVDTGAVRVAGFTHDSRALYCVDSPESRSIRIIRFSPEGAMAERIKFSDGFPTQVWSDPDGERLFVRIRMQDLLDRVAVVDLLSGAELYSEFIFPGDGIVAGAPGWPWLVYTNSGREGGPEGSSSFKIFDLAANRPVREVRTRRFVNDSTPAAFPVGQAVVTPDGRKMVALDAPEGRQLLVYDLQSDRFLDWLPLGEEAAVAALSVQLRP